MKTLSMLCSSAFMILWILGIICPINLFAVIFLMTVIIMGFLPIIGDLLCAHLYKKR